MRNFLKKSKDFKIYVYTTYYIHRWLKLFVCSFLGNKIVLVFAAIMSE